MPIELFTGNSLKALALAFAHHYQQPRGEILTPDTVIVQSMGMQRWLAMQISDYCGICANMRFLFPNNFFKDVIKRLFQYDGDVIDKCSRDAVLWRLMQTLPKLKKYPEFAFINNYLADDKLGLKCYQLSHKLADLYDQYAIFRPAWVKSWLNASSAQLKSFAEHTFQSDTQLQSAYVWQALLWQRVLGSVASNCQWPFLFNQLDGMLSDPVRAKFLPKEIFVFGVSYLPPLYVDLLQILARKTNIYMFLLNPCEKYWSDLPSTYTARKIEKEFLGQYAHLTPTELDEMAHIGGANRLLANWGVLGKQMFQKLLETSMDFREHFVSPGYDSILHVLQSDILELTGRGGAEDATQTAPAGFGAKAPKLPFNANDKSLQVHVCHSKLREIEVLHDNLLDMFDRDPGLLPEEVVVIAPDISVYEPYINAVFSSRVSHNRRLNFSVADKLPVKQGLATAFFMLLDINKSRFEADKVLSLLEIESVRKAFNIDITELPQIETWLKNAQIRWGLSGAYKNEVINISYPRNKVDYAENTWSQGLQRLLLTCAMPGEMQNEPFENVLGVNDVEFDKKSLLGNFIDFFNALSRFYQIFSQQHTPDQWQSLILDYINTFFTVENYAPELDMLQKALHDLGAYSALANFNSELHLETVRKFLYNKLESGDFERGFLSGGITFCSAKPMRSIPFRVVCFLGMDLESFPAREYNSSFDLMAQNRSPGDRSKRLDDKYLFLEALVSARDVFYVSYTGYDLNDNSTVPPSVLVSELLGTVEESFMPQNGINVMDHVLAGHKLHAFDRAYFSDFEPRLFSYSHENFLISQGAAKARVCFVETEHALSKDEAQKLTGLTPLDFINFFCNPARVYAQKRLNISLNMATDELPDKEPFKLSGLENYELKQKMLELMLEDIAPAHILERLKPTGILPHGNLALREISRVYGELKPFAARLKTFMRQNFAQNPPFNETIAVNAGGLSIKGPLPLLCFNTGKHAKPVGLLYFSYSNDKPAHKLSAWLCHLLAQAAGLSQNTVFMDIGQTVYLEPVANYDEYLAQLGALYLKGLSLPLPFFVETGFEYAGLLHKKAENAAEACLAKWRPNTFTGFKGESGDAYVNLCFAEEFSGEIPPAFFETARQIWEPFFKHTVREEEGV